MNVNGYMRKCAVRSLLCAALAALAVCLPACGAETPETTTAATTVASSASEETTATSAEPVAPGTVLVENGKSDYLVINARTASSEVTMATRDFISDLEKKTGVRLKLYPESYAETECEILVGMVHDRALSVQCMNDVDYTSWTLRLEGKKLIVTAYSEEGVSAALKELLACVEEREDKWVVPAGLTRSGTTNGGKHAIPSCESESAYVAGIYQSAREGIEVCLRHVKNGEYEAYGKTLTDAGWVKYTDNVMGQNLYATYTHADGKTLHIGYYPSLQGGTLRIVSVPTGYLPPTEAPSFTRVTDTTFTQIKRDGVELNTAAGMSYIMQLADASFIIIDGGPANTKDEDALLAYLRSLTPDGGKPVIAAWFITHAHPDHMALANNFLIKYHDQVEIRMAAYNFPVYETVQHAADVNSNRSAFEPMIRLFIESITKYWPDAEHFVIHAGQKLYLADAEIEILFTHEDLFPLEYVWVNHTSIAFRIRSGGKTIMILGDCEKTICQQMADTYGAYLKSDMLQLAHHGANGACLDLYRCIDPDICFWACPKSKYESDPRQLGTMEGFEFNFYLRDTSIKTREHYHNSVTTVIPISKK
ncbi:MAG: MBL fold metallo-hydrolase [Clostridia bacterium]|nr:MBL fold metallo-hydrolase [Clostridia bacterium]